MTVTMAIHEIKDRLSSVLAQLTATGEEVEITKHGRVVAVLVPPRPTGVILGLGTRPGGQTPSVEALRWSDDELRDMFGESILPA
jgi:prevent-host-death family protein